MFVALVGCTFILMIAVFYIYDWFVQRRNRKLTLNAARSNEIVSAMFPGALRDKIVAQQKDKNRERQSLWAVRSTSRQMQNMVEDIGGNNTSDLGETNPLADLYPAVTVMVRVSLQVDGITRSPISPIACFLSLLMWLDLRLGPRYAIQLKFSNCSKPFTRTSICLPGDAKSSKSRPLVSVSLIPCSMRFFYKRNSFFLLSLYCFQAIVMSQ